MKPLPLALLLSLLLHPLGALAQAPFRAPGVLNELSGCGRGKAPEAAKPFCANFDEGKLFAADPQIRAAKQKCLAFYEVALRLQNTFCSYSVDAVVFAATSEAKAQEDVVGEQNVSQEVVSNDNRKIVEINKAYMAKFSELAGKFKTATQEYILSIYKLNAAGGSDLAYEALCSPSLVQGQVPGYLRELLAALSFASARITAESMMNAVRENHRQLKAVKEEAEENWRLAEMRAVAGGTVIKDVVEQKTPEPGPDAPIKLPTVIGQDGITGMFVSMSQMVAGRYGELMKIGAGVLGGGGIVVVKVSKGMPIKVPETALSLISILSPVSGLIGGGALLVMRVDEQIVHSYEDFSRDQLAKNINLTSMELMAKWAQRTTNPECGTNVAKEAACVETRKTMKPYEHNECSRSPIDNRNRPSTIR